MVHAVTFMNLPYTHEPVWLYKLTYLLFTDQLV